LREKNVLASVVKNIFAFAFVIPTSYFFGSWAYLALSTGFDLFAALWVFRAQPMPTQLYGVG
jgi:hypothetical protein